MTIQQKLRQSPMQIRTIFRETMKLWSIGRAGVRVGGKPGGRVRCGWAVHSSPSTTNQWLLPHRFPSPSPACRLLQQLQIIIQTVDARTLVLLTHARSSTRRYLLAVFVAAESGDRVTATAVGAEILPRRGRTASLVWRFRHRFLLGGTCWLNERTCPYKKNSFRMMKKMQNHSAGSEQ